MAETKTVEETVMGGPVKDIQNPIKELKKKLKTMTDAILNDDCITVEDSDIFNIFQLLVDLRKESMKKRKQMAETKTVEETVMEEGLLKDDETVTSETLPPQMNVDEELKTPESDQTLSSPVEEMKDIGDNPMKTGTSEALKKDGDEDNISTQTESKLNLTDEENLVESGQENAETKTVEGTVMEEGLVKDDPNNALQMAEKQTVKPQTESKNVDEELKTPESDQTLSVEERRPKKSKEQLVDLLSRLPCSCATEDTIVMKDVLALVSRSTAAQAFFGQITLPINKLLNPTSIQRSYSDASLQSQLVSIVSLIAQHNDNVRSTIVQIAMPFLIACFKSQIEIRRKAAAAISELATLDSNRKKIGESGVMKPLVKLIQVEGDPEVLTHAGRTIRFLCSEAVENRRGAVSEGAVIAVIDKIKNGIFVEEMLGTLEVLSGDERAIAELEDDNDMLDCLFRILREDANATATATVTDKGKEYCMLIIHAVCVHGNVAPMVMFHARQTLQSVAITGTTNARKKAADLLSGLGCRY